MKMIQSIFFVFLLISSSQFKGFSQTLLENEYKQFNKGDSVQEIVVYPIYPEDYKTPNYWRRTYKFNSNEKIISAECFRKDSSLIWSRYFEYDDQVRLIKKTSWYGDEESVVEYSYEDKSSEKKVTRSGSIELVIEAPEGPKEEIIRNEKGDVIQIKEYQNLENGETDISSTTISIEYDSNENWIRKSFETDGKKRTTFIREIIYRVNKSNSIEETE